jgi:hypothetical protein
MEYDDRYRGRYVPFGVIRWNIGRQGRGWAGDEFDRSFDVMPHKIEATDGKVFFNEEQRLKVLGALLENLGIDRVVRFGDPALWRAAVAELPG